MPGLPGIFLRGVAMGAADVVPGVSGGTIALITGIYDRLLTALSRVDATALRWVLRGRIKEAWQHVDGLFMAVLLAGIVTAVLTLAKAIGWALDEHPEMLWAFFFGLVGASAVYLGHGEVSLRLRNGLLVLVGAGLAVAIGLAPAGDFLPGLLGFFLAGALAICAMILPGISGSFILLLLGMYEPVIAALTAMQIPELSAFVTGCGLGLLAFSRLLHWLLAVYRQSLMSVLTGFLAGSLVTLWPWQVAVSTIIDRHGELRVIQQVPVMPVQYASAVGDPRVLACGLAALAGVVLIVVTHRWTSSGQD